MMLFFSLGSVRLGAVLLQPIYGLRETESRLIVSGRPWLPKHQKYRLASSPFNA